MHCNVAIPKEAHKVKKNSPIELMKAVKNATEMEHERLAHKNDGNCFNKTYLLVKACER